MRRKPPEIDSAAEASAELETIKGEDRLGIFAKPTVYKRPYWCQSR